MIRIRSFVFSLWFFAASFVLVVLGQLLVVVRPSLLRAYARIWGRAVMSAMPVVGMRFEVSGLENLPSEGPMIIASMHQSAFDTLVWFRLVPHCRYIVKIELIRLPLFGRLARMSGQIGVDRAGGAATMRLLLREGGDALAQGQQLVIFPEGTRAAAGQLAPLQPGVAALARHSGLPVIPVATDSGLCWGRGMFGKRPGVIHIAVLPAIEAGLRREVLMQRLQAAFEAGAAALRQGRVPVDNSVH